MSRTRAAATRFLLLVALLHPLQAFGADAGVRAEVRRVVLTRGEAQADPEVVTFRVDLDLHLTNGQRRAFGLPMSRVVGANSEKVTILGVDSKQPDKSWLSLLKASWYDNGTLSYEPCTMLRPGSEGDLQNMKSGFLLLKKQLPGLGDEPTLRLQLMIFCRQPSGKVFAQDLMTEPFTVRLP
jgi:hypothetical protein